MRDLDTIESELRLLAAVRWSIREHGGEPSSRQIDELLDERNKLTGSYLLGQGPRDRVVDEIAEFTVLIGAPRSAQRTALLRDHTDRLVMEPVFEEHLGVFVPAVWRRLS
jgi:hypothetical protein